MISKVLRLRVSPPSIPVEATPTILIRNGGIGNEEKTSWHRIVIGGNGLFFSHCCHGATPAY
jgi:hypothetical protein